MKNAVVAGLQWGDEGKGKIVDYLADDFEAVARFNGGSNAGHTIVIGGERHVFHLLPAGALKGKRLLLGPGVALDPLIFSDEIALLRRMGLKPEVTVDGRCTLVTPLEKMLDETLEELRGARALGTTLRGIGPAYAMRALRLVPRAMDLFAARFDFDSARAFLRLMGVRPPTLRTWIAASRNALRGKLGDVASMVTELNEDGSAVLFEASQGALLDLLYGTYPYVTGSQTIASHAGSSLATSLGHTNVIGVVKCYATRVGAGPFPTEIKGRVSGKIREVGKEYGATTGRPRRVGWLDLVALRYAVRLNAVKQVALTKIDVLEHVNELKVCVAYRHNGRLVGDFYDALPEIDNMKPVYHEMKPFLDARMDHGRLPRVVESFIEFLEGQLKVHVRLVSYGEERSHTIER